MLTLLARYYQFAGRIREEYGRITHNDIAIKVGKHDQLVGRITEHCHVSIEDAEVLAREASGRIALGSGSSRAALTFLF